MRREFALYISFRCRVAASNIHHLVSECQVLKLRTEHLEKPFRSPLPCLEHESYHFTILE